MMLHSTVAKHAEARFGPRTVYSNAAGEFVESLAKILWTAVSTLDVALLTVLRVTGAIPLKAAKLSTSFQPSSREPNAESKRGARTESAPRRLVDRCASGCCFITSAMLVSNSWIVLRAC